MKDKKWFRLDNAALIFPAVRRRGWNNAFRLSVTLAEDVVPALLDRTLAELRERFPTFFVRLRVGFFWYYLEEISGECRAKKDYAYPLTHMSRRELRECAIRVLYYKNRIAVEFFHSVTDGNGGRVFILSLAARYIELKYGVTVPAEKGLPDRTKAPTDGEISDSFLSIAGKYPLSRAETTVYRLHGTPEPDAYRNLVTGILPTDALRNAAHEYGVKVTPFLAAVMAEAIQGIQAYEKPAGRFRPVRIAIPVDLRRKFGSETLRNFILPVNVGFDPRTGEYTLQELATLISHELAAETIPQKMAARAAANVNPQRNLLIRIVPLLFKNLALRAVYASVGENKGCINISNLGEAELPREMAPYVRRVEFIIGVQYSYPNNCSIVSCGGKTYINMIRSTKETELERRFFSRLVELGIPVEIESNGR